MMMVVSSGPSAGGNVWMAPLISMVAERSGRRVLRTRRIDWPVRFCTVREMICPEFSGQRIRG